MASFEQSQNLDIKPTLEFHYKEVEAVEDREEGEV